MRNILLTAIFFAASASAFAGNSDSPASTSDISSPNIILDVRNIPSNGTDGYTDTTASNQAVYSYKYSGGTGKGGDVTFSKRGKITFTVHLQSDPRYTIDTVTFTDDTNNQLSLPNDPHGKTNAVIQNENTVVQTANYKVTVSDSTASTTIPCDPKIINN